MDASATLIVKRSDGYTHMSKLTKVYFLHTCNLLLWQLYFNFFLKKKKGKKSPPVVSSPHTAIWILFKRLIVVHRLYLSWPLGNLSHLISYILSVTMASLFLPSSPFTLQRLSLVFPLFPKTFPWLALVFSAQHTHHSWVRSSAWLRSNRSHSTVPLCHEGLPSFKTFITIWK